MTLNFINHEEDVVKNREIYRHYVNSWDEIEAIIDGLLNQRKPRSHVEKLYLPIPTHMHVDGTIISIFQEWFHYNVMFFSEQDENGNAVSREFSEKRDFKIFIALKAKELGIKLNGRN